MKNYTSKVSGDKSVSKIESLLVGGGAINISKHYENGALQSIFFQIQIGKNLIPIKLPANIDACYEILKEKYPTNTEIQRKKLKEQTVRTAWKIICDWVEIQLSLIKMKQVELLQVFLPFVLKENVTFYELIKNNNFKMITDNRK